MAVAIIFFWRGNVKCYAPNWSYYWYWSLKQGTVGYDLMSSSLVPNGWIQPSQCSDSDWSSVAWPAVLSEPALPPNLSEQALSAHALWSIASVRCDRLVQQARSKSPVAWAVAHMENVEIVSNAWWYNDISSYLNLCNRKNICIDGIDIKVWEHSSIDQRSNWNGCEWNAVHGWRIFSQSSM